MADRPLRVVHVPAAVGGHAPALAAAERRLGLDSTCVVLEAPPAGYAVDAVLAPAGTGRARRELRRWRLVAELLRRSDVVHFNFGRPLTPLTYPRSVTRRPPSPWDAYTRLVELRDLPLLRRAGKAVFVTYQGDDVRPARLADASLRDLYDDGLDARKQSWAATFDRYAHGIYALNPDLLEVLPGRARFLPYASVDLDAWRAVPPRASGVPVVVHAPSDRRVKGTDRILAALDRLRADGVEFELELVEGRTRDDARRAYQRADLFVDQVLLGWYGGVAVEAMALGKPVVARLDASQLARLPTGMREALPVIDAGDDVGATLREWLTSRRAELPQVGARSRAYVERWHDPLSIAETVAADYAAAVGR